MLKTIRGSTGITAEDRRLEKDVFAEAIENAAPTLTHRSLSYLIHARKASQIVTQNVDNLHRLSALMYVKPVVIFFG